MSTLAKGPLYLAGTSSERSDADFLIHEVSRHGWRRIEFEQQVRARQLARLGVLRFNNNK